MASPEKTFSGQQSYHEMLVRAQAASPALLYAVCKMLLSIQIKVKDPQQVSEFISVHREGEKFAHFFSSHDVWNSRMSKFLTHAFSGFNINIEFGGDHFERQRLIVDTQFLEWLQSDVVTVDDTKKLVTINM